MPGAAWMVMLMPPPAGAASLAVTAGMPVNPTPALDADDVAALLIGQSRSFTRSDVSRLSGVSVIGARKFWHALGFPDVSSRDRPYTEADLRALRRMATLVRAEVELARAEITRDVRRRDTERLEL